VLLANRTTMKRFLAPAGVRQSITHALLSASVLLRRGQDSSASLAALREPLGVQYVFGAGSARAGLYLALKALHRLEPKRNVVAIPAYTCFSVAAAAVRAGFKIYPLELLPETLDFDYRDLERLPSQGLLGIVTANLFGFANDISRISRIAHSKGAFVIDDAAQSLGATRDRKASGTCADIGVFSLGRGKPLPAGEGGLIVTDSSRIATVLTGEFRSATRCSFQQEAKLLVKVILAAVFLHPRLYRIPNSMKFLKLGVTEFDPTFPVTELSKISRTLLLRNIGLLSELNRLRATKASRIRWRKITNFHAPEQPAESMPTYLRFPLLAKNHVLRDQAVLELWRAGIGATPFYPSAICDIPGIDRHMAIPDFHRPRAEEISRRLLTLPTHSFVETRDIDRMIDILDRGLGSQAIVPSATATANAIS
jgi:dTDP-4-amino-4,6-dideoxygalactose transaminase